MKKVLIISTSLRLYANSRSLAEEFTRGAADAGNITEFISLSGRDIGFCVGCLACQDPEVQHCVIEDDANQITEKLAKADVVAFATPIYFYEMSGQLKTLLDRFNPLFPREYNFRDVYFLSTSADENSNSADRAVNGLKGWIECFPKAHLAGTVHAGGVDSPGDIKNHQALALAYKLGNSIH